MEEQDKTQDEAVTPADDTAIVEEAAADNGDAEAPKAETPKSDAPAGGQSKLFVGGISWGTTDEGLKAAFEAFGTVVSAEVIREKMTGRSKGFGFVVMGSDAEAQAAVDKMNGQQLDGRQVTVNVARPKTESRDRDRGGDRGFDRGDRGGDRNYR